jgi:hypothetical protein
LVMTMRLKGPRDSCGPFSFEGNQVQMQANKIGALTTCLAVLLLLAALAVAAWLPKVVDVPRVTQVPGGSTMLGEARLQSVGTVDDGSESESITFDGIRCVWTVEAEDYSSQPRTLTTLSRIVVTSDSCGTSPTGSPSAASVTSPRPHAKTGSTHPGGHEISTSIHALTDSPTARVASGNYGAGGYAAGEGVDARG